MNELQVIEEKRKLLEKKNKLLNELSTINTKNNDLQNNCNHRLVFIVCDNEPHKIGRIIQYYCPLCEKLETIIPYHNKKHSFENSRQIDLSFINILQYENVFSIISNHVSNDLDFYYNEDNSDELIKDTIIKYINEERTIIKKRLFI